MYLRTDGSPTATSSAMFSLAEKIMQADQKRVLREASGLLGHEHHKGKRSCIVETKAKQLAS